MRKYNLIVVLGYGFIDNWKLSEHVITRLKKAAKLYHDGVADTIAVCGKWSLAWDKSNIVPLITEAEAMKQVLINEHVPGKAIFKEEYSKDTVGNAYYLKTKILKKTNRKHLLILCANYVLDRVKNVFYKVYDSAYSIKILPTETQYKVDREVLEAQAEVLKLQKISA